MDQEHEAWLAERRGSIGGTDVAALAGLNPYRTAWDVYLDLTGLAEPRTPSEPMRWGIALEAVIADEYSRRTGRAVEKPRPKLVRHPHFAWAVGSPDRLAPDRSFGLEIKTAGLRAAHRWGEDGSDEIPEEYLCQVQWYAHLTGIRDWEVAALIGGQEMRIYRIEYDRGLGEELFRIAREFWQEHVAPRVPPPVDGSEAAALYVAARHPRHLREELALATPAVDAAMRELLDARRQRERAEERERLLESLLKTAIGDGLGFQGEGWTLTWKASTDRRHIDWRAVAEELGAPDDIVSRHASVQPGPRRFLPRWAK